MGNLPLLSLVVWTPILGGLWVLFAGARVPDRAIKIDSLLISVATFVLSMPLYTRFDQSTAEMQFVELYPWIEAFNINYHLGIDGIALPLILLTTFTTVLVVLAGWEVIKDRVSQYMAVFLLLEGFMNGVFAAQD